MLWHLNRDVIVMLNHNLGGVFVRIIDKTSSNRAYDTNTNHVNSYLYLPSMYINYSKRVDVVWSVVVVLKSTLPWHFYDSQQHK